MQERKESLGELIEEMCRLQNILISDGIQQGVPLGIEKGKKQGERKAKKQALSRMLEKGTYSREEMAEIVGLPIEKIAEAEKNHREKKGEKKDVEPCRRSD